MNDNERETCVNGMRTLPPIEIDCSTWMPEIPPEESPYVVVKRTLTPVEVDCSGWDAAAAEPQPQLTVSVQFEDGELSDSFVRAIHQTDPNVRLEREPSTTVVLALPNHSAVAALYDAFQGLQAAGCVIGSEHGKFRVRRKAS